MAKRPVFRDRPFFISIFNIVLDNIYKFSIVLTMILLNKKGVVMKSSVLMYVCLLSILIGSAFSVFNDALPGTYFPPCTENPYLHREIDPYHSFAPMAIDSTPDYPPFHDLPVYTAGVTWYDMQHNVTKGRNIAVDPNGGVHISWMNALDVGSVTRRAYYNYFDPDSGKFICSDSTGARTDSRARAGYTNVSVDDENTVPTVVFHDAGSGSSLLKTNAAIDGTYYATFGASRCSFIPPLTGPDPFLFFGVDVQAIWPKVAQIDTTVFIVSTPRISDTIIGGEYFGQKVVYHRGFVKPIWGGISELTFEPPVELAYDQIGITCDVAAYNNSIIPKVVVAWINPDSITMADTCFCDDPTMWANLFDAAEILIRTSSDMGATWGAAENVTYAGVHIYSDYPDSLYIGWYLDSAVVPPETVDVYRPVYTRPTDLNVTYDDDGNVHLVWGGALISPDEGFENECFGSCSVSVWCRSIICHWNEATGIIDTVIIDPIGYCNEISGISYLGSTIEPEIAIDDENVLYVCWEQLYAELLWEDIDSTDTLYYDRSDDGIETAEIFCAVYHPDSAYWSDPCNISNTYTPLCTLGACAYELDMSLAERVNDNVHMFFIEDTWSGHSVPDGTASLCKAKYYPVPKDSLLLWCYRGWIDGIIEGEPGAAIPTTFRLGSNYPNPFNAATAFWFDVYTPGHYTIDVLDITGRIVSRIISSDMKSGRYNHVWNGFSDNGWLVPSGVYFLRAKNDGGGEMTRKITLIK